MSAFETFEICLKSETSLVSFLPTTLFTPARDLHRKRVPKLPNPIQPKLVLDLFPSQSVCKHLQHLRKVAIRCSLNLVFLMQVTVTVLVANGGFGLLVLRFSPFRPANSSFEFPATLSGKYFISLAPSALAQLPENGRREQRASRGHIFLYSVALELAAGA